MRCCGPAEEGSTQARGHCAGWFGTRGDEQGAWDLFKQGLGGEKIDQAGRPCRAWKELVRNWGTHSLGWL
jgi:hypothetical protein